MYKIVWGLGMTYLTYSISKYEKEIPRCARDDRAIRWLWGQKWRFASELLIYTTIAMRIATSASSKKEPVIPNEAKRNEEPQQEEQILKTQSFIPNEFRFIGRNEESPSIITTINFIEIKFITMPIRGGIMNLLHLCKIKLDA